MNVSVGIGGSAHDFATCIISEAGEFFAIEDERLSRVRYDLFSNKPCELSFKYVLDLAKININEVTEVIGNDLLSTNINRVQSNKNIGTKVSKIDRTKFPPINFLNHHLTHAYSAFFSSSFREAAILVVDGTGSQTSIGSENPIRETMTYSIGRLNSIAHISSVVGDSIGLGFNPENPPLFNNSLGHFYRIITQILGFDWMNAGKTMGLAPYGDEKYVDEILKHIKLLGDGQFEINIGGDKGLIKNVSKLREVEIARDGIFKVDSSLAFGFQYALETILFHSLDFLWEKTKTPNLRLAGGVALNALANGKIVERTKFKNVHVTYAPGDGGTGIGAAMWDFVRKREAMGKIIRFDNGPFCGRKYSNYEYELAIRSNRLSAKNPNNLFRFIAQHIANGKTVAWFEGSCEFGPRALGHRSILSDPRNPKMLNHINHNIKNREWFRPVAPAVIEPAVQKYFKADCYSPYMQFVWNVNEPYKEELPAITHVDGSSRIQSVKKRGNESFYELLLAYEELTGFPILINTSFNINGEPIVETPNQAITAFMKSAIDILVLGEYVIQKQ